MALSRPALRYKRGDLAVPTQGLCPPPGTRCELKTCQMAGFPTPHALPSLLILLIALLILVFSELLGIGI